MKIIVCFRHLRCICRKWRRGIDYSWHVQHLLREFGRGHNKIQIAKAVNVTVVKLDDAPKGYVDFDKGTAKKFVLDPHSLLAA